MEERRYYRTMSIFAFISLLLVLLATGDLINLKQGIVHVLDGMILVIYLLDYFIRWKRASKKILFMNHNIFELLTILPLITFVPGFQSETLYHLGMMARLMNIFRLFKLSRRLQDNVESFLYKNRFIYLLYTSFLILFFAALLFSIGEKRSLIDSLWWALETAVTVGYGDLVPKTSLGRLSGVIVMLLGVGFIGSLSSSLTRYYMTKGKKMPTLEDLNRIERKIDQLLKEKDNNGN